MQKFDAVDGNASYPEPESRVKAPPLWGSARLCYTICAFLAMVIQLCLRNTLNFVILYMVKHRPVDNATRSMEEFEVDNECGAIDSTSDRRAIGDIEWTRNQEFYLLGTFYYGYLVTLPIAGRLSDRFGGKLFFVHSITVQAVVFMMMPFFAERSYTAAVVIRIIQGLSAGCGNPALYQLFSTWAHSSERTTFLAVAYTGFSAGSLLVFPISSFLCKLGWQFAFYGIGGVALVFGLCCQWLVYNTLEEHPRLSKEEYEYLKSTQVAKSTTGVPWKRVLTSVPIYAFVFTHICHTYCIMVFVLLTPRFLKEAMRMSMSDVGIWSASPFFGSFISKGVTIVTCSMIEKRTPDLTRFRRIVLVCCNICTTLFILGVVLCDCKQKAAVVLLMVGVGISADLAFSGAYWPSLLFVAPTFAGMISGIANCFANISGFLAPVAISGIVVHGNKAEWNIVFYTVIASYILAATIYGMFGSSKLAEWGKEEVVENNNDQTDES